MFLSENKKVLSLTILFYFVIKLSVLRQKKIKSLHEFDCVHRTRVSMKKGLTSAAS